jgi:hypothetical protein
MAFQTTYDFEELKLPGLGEGCLLYGQATLQDDGTGDFMITSIVLDGKRTLPMPVDTGNCFERMLCQQIMGVLYDDKTVDGRHCAQEWADDLVSSKQPDPDAARDARIDDLAYFGGHSSVARLERLLRVVE